MLFCEIFLFVIMDNNIVILIYGINSVILIFWTLFTGPYSYVPNCRGQLRGCWLQNCGKSLKGNGRFYQKMSKIHKNWGILWYILKKGSIKIFPSCKVINREGVLIILVTRVVNFSKNCNHPPPFLQVGA